MRKILLISILGCFCTVSVMQARVLVLGAVPQEIAPLVDALEDHETVEVMGIPCDLGRLGETEVVIALTGVGKTNTALTTTTLLLRFEPEAAVMTGTAARIRASVRTGDVILVERVSFHDTGSLTRDGMVQGSLQKDGSLAPMRWWGPKRERANPYTFEPTADLLAWAVELVSAEPLAPLNVDGDVYRPIVRSGVVATGDLSGVTEVKIADLRDKLDPDLMEMESAAFAQVCDFFEVPYLIVRSGSNVAQERNSDDYLRLGPIAARQAAGVTKQLLLAWPK